jgi:rhodanese-related sulfurtransferase
MKLIVTLVVATVVCVLLVKALFLQSAITEQKSVTVEKARAIIAADTTVLVLDVRTPQEYTGELGHIENSLLIPVEELEKRIAELEKFKGKTILAVCRSGRRSGTATEILVKNGYKAMNVEGGMLAWNAKELPVSH